MDERVCNVCGKSVQEAAELAYCENCTNLFCEDCGADGENGDLCFECGE